MPTSCDIAMKMIMVMPGILLQKPCKKTSTKQNSEYLNKRMNEWEQGQFDVLLREARGIQEKMKLSKSIYEDPDHIKQNIHQTHAAGESARSLES